MSTPTTNPFPALRSSLISQVYLNPNIALRVHLWALSCVLGLSLVLVVASLGLRAWTKQFWVYRLHPSAFGSWITPNPLVGWLVASAVFLSMAQVFIFYTFRYQDPGSNLHNSMIWRSIIWLPLYIGGLNMTWATALAPLLARHALTPSRFDLSRHPHVVSSFFIFAHLAVCAGVIPTALAANFAFNRAFDTISGLAKILGEASAAYDQGRVADVGALLPTIEAMGALAVEQGNSVVIIWRNLFIVFSAFDGLLTIGFFAAAYAHYKSLRNSMRQLKERNSSSGSSYSRQMTALVRTYYALIFTSCVTAAIASCYLSVGIFIAVQVREVARGSVASKVIQLLSLYVYAVFGSMTNIVMFVRSLTPNAAQPALRRKSSTWDRADLSSSESSGHVFISVSLSTAVVVDDAEKVELERVRGPASEQEEAG